MALLSPHLLETISELKTYLKVTGSTDQEIITDLANDAYGQMCAWTDQELASATHREMLNGTGRASWRVTHRPITELVSIDLEDEAAVTLASVGTMSAFSSSGVTCTAGGTFTGRTRSVFDFTVGTGGALGSASVTAAWTSSYGRSGTIALNATATAYTVTHGLTVTTPSSGTLVAGETASVTVDSTVVRFDEDHIKFIDGGTVFTKGTQNVNVVYVGGYNSTDYPNEYQSLKRVLFELVGVGLKRYQDGFATDQVQRIGGATGGFVAYSLDDLRPDSRRTLMKFRRVA
ncbi:MAG: hypothetical protein VW405_02875 [Rhodospirillaceae bacterium]